MNSVVIEKPEAGEYVPYFAKYIELVHGDVLEALATQIDPSVAVLRTVSEEGSLTRYAPGKWSMREVIGHLIDAERMFAYRALCFARNDRSELPGFEQDDYVAAARSDSRTWSELLAEIELVRRANVLMFRGFQQEAWLRHGVANGNRISVRALAYSIAGHELHHMRIIREKYLAR
ncbi:MAG: DinB family protein [Luteitalea sp.]|nr:DinB family protein [Luteitalea sp.]